MKRLDVHTENPRKLFVTKAADVLKNGGLIIYPTDTVYGIGCDLYNKAALEKLYWLKGKSKFEPISVIVKDIREASFYARISNYAYRLLRHCLPGPFTFILPATREIPRIMLSKRKEVGIRIPDCNVCHSILEILHNPLVNSSVNVSSDELLNDPDEIESHYGGNVDLMLDAGWISDPVESTVVSLIADEINILREGKGSIDKLYER